MARRKTPRIPDALLDQLLSGADPKTAFDPDDCEDAFRNINTREELAAAGKT